MNTIKKLLVVFLPLLFFFLFSHQSDFPLYAQTPTPLSDESKENLQNQIRDLEQKINTLKNTEETLSFELTKIDDQMKISTLKINLTKKEIISLEEDIQSTATKISELEKSLDRVGNLFLERVVATYKAKTIQPLQLLMSTKNLSDFVVKEAYLRLMRNHDKQLMLLTQMSKVNFGEQKQALEDKQEKLRQLQSELELFTKQLSQEEKKKKTLLAQTQGSEANYKKLLAQAKAQLAGFSNFVANQGGASLLSGQTHCSDWGCYYSQRDSQWGSTALNHTQYTLASDGCLVTSMAMVLSHYGHKVTPVDINNNSSNFASYYPAYLLYTISAGGVTADRIGASIDATLSHGDPLVVGVHAYGGTHFVVLISGSNGNYKMHDPYLANGHDISFTDHYSVGSIFEIHKVVVH